MSEFGRHTTVDRVIRRKLHWLLDHSEVKKIVIGRSRGATHGHGDGDLKVQAILPTGAIRFLAYSSHGLTECYAYCLVVDQEIVRNLIERA